MLKTPLYLLIITAMTTMLGTSSAFGDSNAIDDIAVIKNIGSHEYEPPPSGKLSQNQVEEFIVITEKAEELENKYSGDTHRKRLALIEAVFSEEGNWAEYQWVHSQLRQVAITSQVNVEHRDAANRHNSQLFETYQNRLQPLLQ
ncbi:hypothetical protein SAMN05443545_102253 [Aidingimonas halophila]|uniref:DUF4168 domain-containing protein n=3 Tax=Aidingimonas halophila TaxID=574349 RepID=A0A1H2UVK6_9GAMM|nr:hypothetical protein GCM10008094_12500 [Aidingimonas halophila]SDW60137.1 hypothetical protein SAMN05443545_102253 [Aidingimonas halophila]